MALPACTRCGTVDPRRMYGLMTLWFGPFADIEPAQGYFYLCPACYRKFVHPHLEKVQGKLAELHPAAAAHLEKEAERHHRPDIGGAPPQAPPLESDDESAQDENGAGDGISRSA